MGRQSEFISPLESGQKSAFDSDLFCRLTNLHSKDPRDYFVPDSELPPSKWI